MTARKLAFRVLLASVAISALLAIIAILGGGMSELSLRILLTTMTISATSLLAMAAFSAWEAEGAWLFSRVGLAASLGMGTLFIGGIWFGVGSDLTARLAVSCMILGIAGAHGSLLSLARLAPAYRRARPIGHAIGTLLVGLLLGVLWDVIDGDAVWRAIGTLTVLDVASTVTILVLHVMGRVAPPEGAVPEVRYCPGCGKRLWVAYGHVRCPHCADHYVVELHPNDDLPAAFVTKEPE